MKLLRRLTLATVVIALLAAAAYGIGWKLEAGDDANGDRRESAVGQGPARGADVPASPESTPTPADEPTESSVEPGTAPAPEPEAPEVLFELGDSGEGVRKLQARLRQIDWFEQDVTGYFGVVTVAAVEGFQAKRGFPVTGEVDQRTYDRVLEMTAEPSADELSNQLGRLGTNVPGALDPRCLTGPVLCIDKTSQTLRWLVDGTLMKTVDVRFGSEYTPTREGDFQVEYKSRDHVSSLYDSAMPFAMFFSGGQAVHYSSDFAAVGYDGASHGCVNVRDYDAVAWLFDQVEVGDAVIVYRS